MDVWATVGPQTGGERSQEPYEVALTVEKTAVAMKFNRHDRLQVQRARRRPGRGGVNALLERARNASLEAKSLELTAPPGTPVTLPQVTPSGRVDRGVSAGSGAWSSRAAPLHWRSVMRRLEDLLGRAADHHVAPEHL